MKVDTSGNSAPVTQQQKQQTPKNSAIFSDEISFSQSIPIRKKYRLKNMIKLIRLVQQSGTKGTRA